MGKSEKPSYRYHIRWLIRRDMPEVLQIEGTHSETMWNEQDFLKVLRERNVIGMVVEHEEKIVGFVIYELQKGSINILNMAVDPEYRRRKAGTAIIEKLKGKLSTHRRKHLICDVRETNLDTHLFFKNQGLVAYKVLRNYFEDYNGPSETRYEDAYCFRYTVEETAPKDEVETCGR